MSEMWTRCPAKRYRYVKIAGCGMRIQLKSEGKRKERQKREERLSKANLPSSGFYQAAPGA